MSTPEPNLSSQLNLAALRGQPGVSAAAVTGWLDAGAPELDAPLSPEQAQAAARCRELLTLTQTALAELTPQALAARPGVTLTELSDGPGRRAQIALNMNQIGRAHV